MFRTDAAGRGLALTLNLKISRLESPLTHHKVKSHQITSPDCNQWEAANDWRDRLVNWQERSCFSQILCKEQYLSLAFFSKMKHHADEQNLHAFFGPCNVISVTPVTPDISSVNNLSDLSHETKILCNGQKHFCFSSTDSDISKIQVSPEVCNKWNNGSEYISASCSWPVNTFLYTADRNEQMWLPQCPSNLREVWSYSGRSPSNHMVLK